MDSKFRSSFIPKRTLESGGLKNKERYRTFNIFTFIGVVVFVIAVISSATLFGYKYVIEGRINEKGIALEKVRDDINPEHIGNLKQIDNRIKTVESLLNKHTTVSTFFEFLEKSTLRNVQFSNFVYKIDEDNLIKISLEGNARSYNSLVLQSNIFENSNILLDLDISNIKLDDSGNITFTVAAVLDRDSVLYIRSNIESIIWNN